MNELKKMLDESNALKDHEENKKALAKVKDFVKLVEIGFPSRLWFSDHIPVGAVFN